jgi:hypothetical protein
MSQFSSFSAFYPFYLGQHQNLVCRRLHVIGSIGVLGFLLRSIVSGNPYWLLAALLSGYGFAWIGHFFFERNRPATFSHPIYSFIGDWVMLKDILIGRIKL